MEYWYTEEHSENARFSIRVDRQLYSAKSKFQRIDIFEAEEFGRRRLIEFDVVFHTENTDAFE